MSKVLYPGREVIHRLPVNYQEYDSRDFLPEKHYCTQDVRLLSHKSTMVTADSVVYRNGILLTDSLPENTDKSYYRFRYPIKQLLTGRKVRLGAGLYLLATDIWSSGHFHWLCDTLPRLYCLKGKTESFRLLLPDTLYLRKVGIDSLESLGLNFSDIIWMKPGDCYYIRELFRITPIAPSGHFHPEIMNSLREEFTYGIRSLQRRIYISRANAAFRKVLNESDLLSLLDQYGFEVCEAEHLTFREQIQKFAEAKWLIGIHGAGLANACFMPAGSGLVEFRRNEKSATNVGYWHLSDALGLNYYYLNGNPDLNSSIVGRGCNLNISISSLDAMLQSLFSNNNNQ